MKLYREIREFIVILIVVSGFMLVYVPYTLARDFVASTGNNFWEVVIVTTIAAIVVSLFVAAI